MIEKYVKSTLHLSNRTYHNSFSLIYNEIQNLKITSEQKAIYIKRKEKNTAKIPLNNLIENIEESINPHKDLLRQTIIFILNSYDLQDNNTEHLYYIPLIKYLDSLPSYFKLVHVKNRHVNNIHFLYETGMVFYNVRTGNLRVVNITIDNEYFKYEQDIAIDLRGNYQGLKNYQSTIDSLLLFIQYNYLKKINRYIYHPIESLETVRLYKNGVFGIFPFYETDLPDNVKDYIVLNLPAKREEDEVRPSEEVIGNVNPSESVDGED